ncbi:MAG: helix-turn-helix domain-containing protein [Myxococcaceae bacterium]
MSGEKGGSGSSQEFAPDDKSLESLERGEAEPVQDVRGSPPVRTGFGTHLVPRKPIAADQLLTVKQVAERWSVCTATVYALIEAGRLGSIRIQRSIRIPSDDVRLFELDEIETPAGTILPRTRDSR